MPKRPTDIHVWNYPADVTYKHLRRHYLMARWIIRVWAISVGIMLTSLGDFLFIHGTNSKAALIIMICSMALCVLSSLPGLFAVFWAGEIEKTVRQREMPPVADDSVGQFVGKFAVKVIFLALAIILTANYIINR